MSFNFEVEGGKSYLLPTGGKYCPEDIGITAIGGATEGMYCWQKCVETQTPPDMDVLNATVTESDGVFSIVATHTTAGFGYCRIDITRSNELTHTVKSTAAVYQVGLSDSSVTLDDKYTSFGPGIYFYAGTLYHYASGSAIANKGSYAVGDVVKMICSENIMTVYKNGEEMFSVTIDDTYTQTSFDIATAGADIGEFTFGTYYSPIGYVLSDNLNAYPQDGYHTDGYYYKLMESDFVWDERGRYAWSKSEGSISNVELTPTGVTLTSTDDGYNMTTTSGNGWGSHYIKTPLLDITGSELTITHIPAATDVTYFIGIAEESVSTYGEMDRSVMLDGGKINDYAGATLVGQKGTFAVGDVLEIKVSDGKLSVTQNGSPLYEVDYTPKQFYVITTFYYGSKDHGIIDCVAGSLAIVGYVIGNEEDAYPNDGYADDGYYYVKVGATKINPKYASGVTKSASGVLTVTGLGFKPHAAMMYYSTTSIAWGVLDASSGTTTGYGRTSSSMAAATFVSNDDGFVLTYSGMGTVQANWYAIGY